MTIERYPLMVRDDDNDCADVDEAERDALMADALDDDPTRDEWGELLEVAS